MINYFKVGVNFDPKLISLFDELNQKYEGKSKIVEVYGSTRGASVLAARPDFRLPDISAKEYENYIKELDKVGIKFNYTLNSIFPYGSKMEFVKHKEAIKAFIGYLEDVGTYRITVANPISLELIKREIPTTMKIELSTIAHIDAVTQIKYYYETYDVDKICNNLIKNRDFEFLKAASEYCNKNGIILELMANEFCGVGGSDYATHCIYRDSCYMCHMANKTLEDANAFNEYPMSLCSQSRNQNPANWLRLKWIRPEDIKYYNDIGINHFKITGRTGSTEYIKRTIESYMSNKFDGNLLNLWKPLESIKGEDEFGAFYKIDNSLLDGFLGPWVKGHKCENEVCGETCRYCERFYYDKIEKKGG